MALERLVVDKMGRMDIRAIAVILGMAAVTTFVLWAVHGVGRLRVVVCICCIDARVGELPGCIGRSRATIGRAVVRDAIRRSWPVPLRVLGPGRCLCTPPMAPAPQSTHLAFLLAMSTQRAGRGASGHGTPPVGTFWELKMS